MAEEEKNPFEHLFDQLGEVLKFLEQYKGQAIDEKKITPEVKAKLAKLEKDVQEFQKLSDMIVSLSDISQEEMIKRLTGISTEIPIQGKLILEKGRRLKSDMVTLSDKFHLKDVYKPEESLPKTKSEEKEESAEEKQKARTRRRRKFKGMDNV